jgi:hypothetical protein
MNETLGNGRSDASFRALMKRIAFCLLAASIPLAFNACEGHKAEDLPEHYQHKMHKDHHDADHAKKDGHAPADPHKPEASKPAEPAKHP